MNHQFNSQNLKIINLVITIYFSQSIWFEHYNIICI